MLDLRKVGLIFKREYITRIRSKAFIISTILIPLGFILLFGISIGIQFIGSDQEHTIAVVDEADGQVFQQLNEINAERYVKIEDAGLDELRNMVMKESIEGYLFFTNDHVESNSPPELIYGGSGGIELVNSIEHDVRSAIRDVQLNRAQVSAQVKDILKNRTQLETRKLTKEGKEEAGNTGFYYALGLIMGFIIYFAMIVYGAIIMRGVIEEKTNRIVEIITSSVKPIELLVGKVLGVGTLGLTQFAIWIVATIGILSFISPLAAMFLDTSATGAAASGSAGGAGLNIPDIDPSLWIYLVLYFLFGYLIYSALFAAVGAAVDNESDTQQLQIPIMIPIILAFIIMPKVISDPDSTMAVVTSLIPIFSPILMLPRIPITDVPFWQIGLSFVLMILTFMAFMWLSAKIYRVGILMYGKKPSFRELVRWIRYR